MKTELTTAIEEFWTARQRGDFFPQAYFNRLTLDDAYRIQLGLIERRVAAGERQIGWKVGLTAEVIQQQFAFHEPVFGCILEAKPSGYVFKSAELLRPGFETELCLRLAKQLEGSASLGEVQDAIDSIYPSFEIIETRGDFSTQAALGIADNAQQRAVILGEAVQFRKDMDLSRVQSHVFINGVEVAAGFGSAVLGDPLRSVTWLSAKLAQYGRRLQAGDIVMTGSFVRQFPLSAGDSAAADFSGIGRVEVFIAPA